MFFLFELNLIVRFRERKNAAANNDEGQPILYLVLMMLRYILWLSFDVLRAYDVESSSNVDNSFAFYTTPFIHLCLHNFILFSARNNIR